MRLRTTLASLFTSRTTRCLLFGLVLFCTLGKIGIHADVLTLNHTIIESVAAAETAKTWTDAADATLTTLVTIGNLAIGVLTFLLTPLIMLAGWLLSPDWTFGDIFGLRIVFKSLWILISNVVYVIFAFILVFVAFANIFGWEHAKAYEMKTMLPKLVIGILIVPFTWFIVSATLSISNILTASVIQLPIDVIQKSPAGKNMLDEKIIPKSIIYYANGAWSGKTIEQASSSPDNDYSKINGNFITDNCNKQWNCISIADLLSNSNGGAYNLLSVYAYGIFRIQDYKTIDFKELKGISNIGNIVSKLSFGLIFFVVFGILLIAIVYALFSRAVMLWMFAIFSPLFALNHVIGDSKSESLKKLSEFSISHFISLAMVPVYVSAALAFGLMFLGAVMNGPSTIGVNDGGVKINTTEDTTTFAFGDITLTTIGVITKGTSDGVNKALGLSGGFIGTIIVNMLALAILWMAVMAALSANEITKVAVKPIADMGNSVGELMKHAPQYIPIAPGGHSMKSMTQWVSGIKWWIETAASSKASDITRRFGFEDAANRNQAYSKLNAATANWQVKPAIDALREMEKTYIDANAAMNDGKFREAVAKLGNMKGIEVDIKPESLNTITWLSKAYRQIDEKLEDKNIGDLVHGKKWNAINETVVAWRFGKTGSDGNEKDTTVSSGFTAAKTASDGINLNFGKSVFEVKLSDKKDAVILDKNDIDSLKKSIGQYTEEEFRKWLSGTMLWSDLTNDLIKKIDSNSSDLKDFFKKEPPKS